MLNARPGDLVVVPHGAYLVAVLGNEESYNEEMVTAVVVSTSCRIVEVEDELVNQVTIFINDRGLFNISEDVLLTPDDYESPGRLFPLARLRDS